MIKINYILCIIVLFNKQNYTYSSDKNKKYGYTIMIKKIKCKYTC